MSALEFRILGPLEVVVGGRPLDLGPAKQRALLALLLLNANQVVPAERLIDELWRGEPPETARHALQVYVSGLRKLLEPHRDPGQAAKVVQTRRPGYRLNLTSDDRCDALRFESLTAKARRALDADQPDSASSLLSEALTSWRGPALADLFYEPFAQREAARLEEVRLAALEDRLEAELRLGHHTKLIGELDALVVCHPLRERIWGMLMLALYRSGRQAEALQAFQRLRETLSGELGLDPGPELQALQERILRQAPQLTWQPAVAPTDAARAEVQAPVPPKGTEPGLPSPTAPGPPRGVEERRPATVLFAELHGFEGLTERLDPEDARAVVDRNMTRLGEIVAHYGGRMETIVGGRLMAVFGVPVAHEDDPERAVRAALDMQRCAGGETEESQGRSLQVGVDTGETLLAPVGPQPGREATITGDAVSIAFRLQAAAPPGAVYVGEGTCRATRGSVDYTQVKPIWVEARKRPVAVWRAVEVSALPHQRRLGRARLVGRQSELDLLRTIWKRTVAEKSPHLVTVLGEPGVGKSRLAAEFIRAIDVRSQVLRGRCLPYGEALTYGPLVMALTQAAGITPQDAPRAARAKLGDLVASVPLLQEPGPSTAARYLALMAGLDTDEDRSTGIVDERMLQAAVRRFLEALGRTRPVCLMVEDIQWADDALLDLIHSLLLKARGTSLLVVTQARPELLDRRPGWGGGLPSYTSLPLEPLDDHDTRELIRELGAAQGLPRPLAAEVARLSGGNPLFAEELVATVAEMGQVPGVPPTLKSLILARLDALPSAERLILQLGSILGTAFWTGALRALGANGRVTEGLGELERRNLIRLEPSSQFAADVEYSFKHALIRDVAYGSLPKRRRRDLHREAVDWIEEAAGQRVEEHLDRLAYHAVQADERKRAFTYLARAGERAQRAAAHRQEAALLAQAIELAQGTVPPGEIAHLRARRGRAYVRVGMWAQARPELEAALPALPPRDRERRAETHLELATVCYWLSDIPALRHHASEALTLADQAARGNLAVAAMAHQSNADIADGATTRALDRGRELIARCRALGVPFPHRAMLSYPALLYWTGRAGEAADLLRAARDAARETHDTATTLWNLPLLGLAVAAQGQYGEALDLFEQARRFGQEYEVWPFLARAIAMSAGPHLDLLDFEGAEALAEEARELARSVSFPAAVVSAGIDLVFNLSRQQEVGRAQQLRDEVARDLQKTAAWKGWLWGLRFTQAQAELALAAGDPESALELSLQARAQSRSKGRRKYEVLSLVTQGAALHSLGRTKDALTNLGLALRIARQLQDPTLLLRAARTLLSIDAQDSVATQARAAAQRIASALPDEALRRRFQDAQLAISAGPLPSPS